jgi:tetratricopeptide (TPR) repeat protein
VVDHGLESGCGAALTTADVAIGLDSVGKSAASVEPYRAAAATLETLVTNDSGNSQWQNELAVVYGGLGEIFIRQGLGDEALDVTRKCLALLQKLADGDPDNGELQAALALTNERIGDVLDREGKLSDALDAYRRNLAIEQRLADHEPGNAIG